MESKNGIDKAVHSAAVADPEWGSVIKELEEKVAALTEEVDDLSVSAAKLDDEIIAKDDTIEELKIRVKELEGALEDIYDIARNSR